ncbi:MAG: GNAT family N-acetyltransferase [Armatimonadota bacterium]
MRISPLSDSDVPAVLDAWHSVLVYDRIPESEFGRVILNDPNYEPEAVLVAKGSDGGVVGLASFLVRRTVPGGDGCGQDYEFDRGFLKAFFVAEGEPGERAADLLLETGENYCAAAGKRVVGVVEYAGPYVFPGLDVRYERLIGVLARRGYRDMRTIEDVAVDLRGSHLPGLLRRAWERVGDSVELLTWRPEMLPLLQELVATGDQPQWFPAGWESRYGEADERVLLLRKGAKLVGWARFHPGAPEGWFGPIMTLPSERGNGYGNLLLLESMVRARDQGTEAMSAGWAATGFYVTNGWHISRRYAVLRKELAG